MPTLETVLSLPSLQQTVRRIDDGASSPAVRAVALVDELAALERMPAGALAILAPSATQGVTNYRLDMGVRVARDREAAALLFTDGRTALPVTTVAIARRGGVALLAGEPNADLAALVTSVDHLLFGDAESLLDRLAATVAALAEDEGDEAALLTALGSAFGATLRLGTPQEGEIGAAVEVDDEPAEAVCCAARGGYDDVGARIVTRLAADAIARMRHAARRAADAPVRSRAELLTEFLLSPPTLADADDRLLQRMRAADIAVDGWHTAIRIEVENLAELAGDDALAAFTIVDRVGRLGYEGAQAAGGVWHRAHVGSALLLVRTARSDPGTGNSRVVAQASRQALARIAARAPELQLVCGVGTVHVGSAGLRATATEARAALGVARAAQRFGIPVWFDEVGLQRTLIEWFSSNAAREAVDLLLRPLDRLGGRKARTAIETLRVYLDNQGSLLRTAEALHLHRNAVSYRMRRILEALEVDIDDPDTRLMLQLACRARTLG